MVDRNVLRGHRNALLLRGVAWFVADPMTFARLACCSRGCAALAHELAPMKKATCVTVLTREGQPYHVLPCGLMHGWRVRSPTWMEYSIDGRCTWWYDGNARETQRGICTWLVGSAFTVWVSDTQITWRKQTPCGGYRRITATVCVHCKRFHEFSLRVHNKTYRLFRKCFETGLHMRMDGVGKFFSKCARHYALCKAVVAYAKAMKPW